MQPDFVGQGLSLQACLQWNLACFAWIYVRRARLTDFGSQSFRLQAVLEGLPPLGDLFGLNSAQALADFVRLPPTHQSTDQDLEYKTNFDLLAIASLGGSAAPIIWLMPVLSFCGTLPAAFTIEDIIAYIGMSDLDKEEISTQTSSNTSAQLSSGPSCQSRINRLYYFILFLKTAALLTSIKYHDSKSQLALKFIWFTVERLVEELTPAQAITADEKSLEKNASVLLVELVVPLLRQLIPTDPPMSYNTSNMLIDALRHLLECSSPVVQSAIGTELLHQGRTNTVSAS